MSLGEHLRTARENQGQKIEDIARTTFIRAHYLEAIERDDFSALPPSRLRYFIQDYARALGLDPVEMTGMIPEDIPAAQPAPPPLPVHDTPSEKKTTFFAAPAAEDDADIPPARTTASAGSRRKRPRYAPIDQGNPALVRGLMTAALVLLVGLGIYYLAGGFDDSGDVAEQADPVQSDTAGGDSQARILSRPDDLPSDDAAADIESGDSLVLEGRARARVWYSIRMDSRQETGTLDSGVVKVWKAEKEFSVSLGNAGGLEFFLDGKSLGVLGPLGATLRGRVINAEGVKETVAPRRRTTTSRQNSSSGNNQATESSQRLRRLENSQPRRAIEPDGSE